MPKRSWKDEEIRRLSEENYSLKTQVRDYARRRQELEMRVRKGEPIPLALEELADKLATSLLNSIILIMANSIFTLHFIENFYVSRVNMLRQIAATGDKAAQEALKKEEELMKPLLERTQKVYKATERYTLN